MIVIFEQVLILLAFAAVGFALSKFKIVDVSHAKIISALLVYVASPCNTFKTFSAKFTVEYVSTHYVFLLFGLATMLFLAVSMHYFAKIFSKDAYTRSVYEYSMITPNFGYMGYALAESLMGLSGLINVMMFGFPTSCFVNTRGYCMLTKTKVTLRRLMNPLMIGMLLGMVFGLVGIPQPALMTDLVSRSSACMAPLSMILMGIAVSEFKFKSLFCNIRAYAIVAMRLVVIPLVIGGLIYFAGYGEVAKSAALVLAMPCGLNTIIFPKLVGEDCEIGASLACVSTILSCISIPLVLTVFGVG